MAVLPVGAPLREGTLQDNLKAALIVRVFRGSEPG